MAPHKDVRLDKNEKVKRNEEEEEERRFTVTEKKDIFFRSGKSGIGFFSGPIFSKFGFGCIFVRVLSHNSPEKKRPALCKKGEGKTPVSQIFEKRSGWTGKKEKDADDWFSAKNN